MLTRRAFAFALAGAAVAAAPGCASVPRNPAPSLRFGDFRLAGREIELRVFADGAGVLVNGSLSTGGMIESRTMERLRALIASPEFNDQLTRPLDDVETKVFGTLPDETWFYPGHGNDSTLGAERGSIPEWRARGW